LIILGRVYGQTVVYRHFVTITPGTTLGRRQLIFPRLIGKQSNVNSSHAFCVTCWPCDELTDCQSTRHNAVKPYGRLETPCNTRIDWVKHDWPRLSHDVPGRLAQYLSCQNTTLWVPHGQCLLRSIMMNICLHEFCVLIRATFLQSTFLRNQWQTTFLNLSITFWRDIKIGRRCLLMQQSWYSVNCRYSIGHRLHAAAKDSGRTFWTTTNRAACSRSSLALWL